MKFVKQFLIILGISFAGEALKFLLPFPIPASIYGMVILLIGLLSGFIPLASVKEAGTFLIEIMPVMFIPAWRWSHGLLAYFTAVFGSGQYYYRRRSDHRHDRDRTLYTMDSA